MRRLRIAQPVQLQLPITPAGGAPTRREQVWAGLPEASRHQVLALLARLIARAAVDAEDAR